MNKKLIIRGLLFIALGTNIMLLWYGFWTPRLTQNFYNQASINISKNEFDKAIVNFSKAIEYDPNFALAYRRRGFSYDQLGNLNQAFENYKKSVELNPFDAIAQHNLGLAYYHRNDIDNALKHYEKAIKLDPAYASAYHNIHVIYKEKKGDLPKALEYINKALSLSDSALFRENRCRLIRDMEKNLEQGITDCNMAIQMNPKDAEPYALRADIYVRQEKLDDALRDYTKAIELDSKEKRYWNARGLTYQKLKQWPTAITDFNESFKLDPTYLCAFSSKMNTYSFMKKYHLALVILDELPSMSPELQEQYKEICNCKDKDAQEIEKRWSAFKTFYRGWLIEQLGFYEKAKEYYERVLKIIPDYDELYLAHGRVSYNLNQMDEAIEDLTKSLKQNPKDASTYWYRSRAYFSKKEFEKSLTDAEQAIALGNTSLISQRDQLRDFIVPKKSGIYTEYYESKKVSEVPYKEGKKNGTIKNYSDDGRLTYSYQMKNDVLEGESIFYPKKGRIQKSYFKNGEFVFMKDDRGKRITPICKLDPNAQKVYSYNNQAYFIFLESGDINEGLQIIEKALAIEPQNPTLLSTKAELLYKQKRYEEAFAIIQKAIELAPDYKSLKEDYEMIQAKLKI